MTDCSLAGWLTDGPVRLLRNPAHALASRHEKRKIRLLVEIDSVLTERAAIDYSEERAFLLIVPRQEDVSSHTRLADRVGFA